MFGRKKDSQPAPGSTTGADKVGSLDAAMDAAAGKGRPTPKRREAEARNRRPLVHNDPKVARSEQRRKNAESRAQMNAAMVTGDDRYLPCSTRARSVATSATTSTRAGRSASSSSRSRSCSWSPRSSSVSAPSSPCR
ncbi:hypothetical protein GCM10025875_14880 [Litorihabitans aurantiacus]|uniref:Uncharacterized protein n=1 Tax=Litorihabitans aurantiacus TaxID=1930061 RepID=A0AA38CQY3_9MICO|nr:hypothetical protein GCM10025875_14880 [Litorihabitans aurantiacus]